MYSYSNRLRSFGHSNQTKTSKLHRNETALSSQRSFNSCPKRLPLKSSEIDDMLISEKIVGNSERAKNHIGKAMNVMFEKFRVSLTNEDEFEIKPCCDHNLGDTSSSPSTCSICLEEYEVGDETAYSRHGRCSHVFHKKCISKWLQSGKDSCPICRKALHETKSRKQTYHTTITRSESRHYISRSCSRSAF